MRPNAPGRRAASSSTRSLALVVPLVTIAALGVRAPAGPFARNDRSAESRIAAATITGEIRFEGPGTSVQVGQMDEFLARALHVTYEAGSGAEPMAVALRLVIVDRNGRTVGDYTLRPVVLQPGKSYVGSRWISGGNLSINTLFEPEHFFELGQTVGTSGRPAMPRGCEEATHALWIGFESDDPAFEELSPAPSAPTLCLTWRR